MLGTLEHLLHAVLRHSGEHVSHRLHRSPRTSLLSMPLLLLCLPFDAQTSVTYVQERNIRQQQQGRAEKSAAEAAAAKGEVAALKALKTTLAEQVLSHEAQVTYCTCALTYLCAFCQEIRPIHDQYPG